MKYSRLTPLPASRNSPLSGTLSADVTRHGDSSGARFAQVAAWASAANQRRGRPPGASVQTTSSPGSSAFPDESKSADRLRLRILIPFVYQSYFYLSAT